MTALPAMPTADMVAVSIVVAASAYEQDPVECFLGWSGARGPRLYVRLTASAALSIAFPRQSRPMVAKLLNVDRRECYGFGNKTRAAMADRPHWYRHDVVNDCLAAIGHPPVTPEEAAEPRPSRPPIIIPGVECGPMPPSLRARNLALGRWVGTSCVPAPPPLPQPFKGALVPTERPPQPTQKPAPRQPSAAAEALADYVRGARSLDGMPRVREPAPPLRRRHVDADPPVKAPVVSPRARVVVHERATGVVDMGDPPPGRSALDQRGGK